MPSNPRAFIAERMSALLKANKDVYNLAVEFRIIDQDWLQNPNAAPPQLSPIETMRRFAERAVERSPSSFRALQLSALQMLTWDKTWDRWAVRGSTEADLTVVFIDLEGFTEFTDTHGDSAALALLDEHNKSVGPIVRRHDGQIVKRIGDGMMIVFPHPGKAVRAGLELVTSDHPLPLRAGAHAGRAVVTDNDVFGNVVNLASRIAGQAQGGQFCISGDLRELAGPLEGIGWTGQWSATLRGISQPVDIWEVVPDGSRRDA